MINRRHFAAANCASRVIELARAILTADAGVSSAIRLPEVTDD